MDMRNQAELFAIEHGSYHGINTSGWSNDDISECRSSGVGGDGTLLDPTMSEAITDVMFEIHKISSLTGFTRVYCGVGRPGIDSWAFAAPLYQPETGTTGWCIDSSGNSKTVNFDFITANSTAVGGRTIKAQCP